MAMPSVLPEKSRATPGGAVDLTPQFHASAMASGHVSRTERPNPWLHQPAQQRLKSHENPEPSTHGPHMGVDRLSSSGDHDLGP